MDQHIIILGDIEMGAGNLTDDFISDTVLASSILAWSKLPGPVDLVLNGDTFDFLKCPSQLQPTTIYPRHITAEISLAKLKLIQAAHRDMAGLLTTALMSIASATQSRLSAVAIMPLKTTSRDSRKTIQTPRVKLPFQITSNIRCLAILQADTCSW